MSSGVSPITTTSGRRNPLADRRLRRLNRDRHQRAAILVRVAERAEPEPPPQIEVAELDRGAALEVAGEQPDAHVAVASSASRMP
jgi:hypothetical protein